MFQTFWDIYDRQRALFMKIANEILDEITDWRPHPTLERDTRWLTNGRSAIDILKGYFIQDEDGTPFWVLLAQRLIYVKKESDWQVQRLTALIEWILMPEMIFSVWVEAEAVQYFEASYGFHAVGGQLSSRPGFRTLELFRFVVEHSFPWWESARKDPASRFPNAVKWVKEEMEDKDKMEMAELKMTQLKYGIQAAHDEMSKMYGKFLSAPWIFTAITCPKRGALILNVLLELMMSVGFDVDAVYDDDGHLIDEDLDWGLYQAPEKTAQYLSFYAKLEKDVDNIVHFFRMLGFAKSKVRNTLKRLSRERGTVRNPDSKTWLLDFAGSHEQAFDVLWAQFALKPSSTRMSEAFHGIERWAYDVQTSHDMRDARGRYLLDNEFTNRQERRIVIYEGDSDEEKKKRKSAPKHCDRSSTWTLAGEQLARNSSQHTSFELSQRFPEAVLKETSVTAVNKRGTTAQQKKYNEQVAELAEAQRKKKLSSERYKPTSIEQYQQNADNRRMSYDEQWERERSPEAILKAKLDKLTKSSHWTNLKVGDGFLTEVEHIFPYYWEKIAEESNGKQLTKTCIMKGTAPIKTSLPVYLEKIRNLAYGEKSRRNIANLKSVVDEQKARELKRADLSGEGMLTEIVKYEKSEILKKREQEESEKYALVRDVIASNGTVHSNDREWQVAMPEIKKISTTYRHPSLEDPDEDDVAWFGPPDDEEGTNANVPEDANMAEDAEMDDDGEN